MLGVFWILKFNVWICGDPRVKSLKGTSDKNKEMHSLGLEPTPLCLPYKTSSTGTPAKVGNKTHAQTEKGK